MFFIANKNYFPETGFLDFIALSFYGLRFDSFSITIANSLFILLSILPLNAINRAPSQKFLQWLFGITNSVFLASNFIDVAYFPFIRKRSSAEIFEQLSGQSDMAKLIPQFILDFWWVILIFIFSVYVLLQLYKRPKINFESNYTFNHPKQWLYVVLIFCISFGLAVLGARGGLQRVPIDIVNAGSVATPEEAPIVLNTPFTLLKSMSQKAVEEHDFYTQEELNKIYNPIHHFKDSTFKKQNVVVLILESFSKEYTKLGRIKSITPFLDSLMNKSLLFTNAFSDGTKSIEGIPAILSSLPSLMENPFINSIYANNQQTSFATLLGKEGYETAFFHGGINGTMNFDSWAPLAGYKYYFGRNEYNNEKDFDGFWGILDEPFLQFAIKKMNEFKEPFHSSIFTLSSHHPYFIPEKYKNMFPKTDLENSESIGYADYSLRQFFSVAQKTSWYKNTFFVITADHASLSNHPFFANQVGNLTIPIMFFKPDNSLSNVNPKVFCQIDILPSVMSLLGYNKPFFAFGQNYNSTKPHNCYYYANGTYFLYTDSMVYRYIGSNYNSKYNYLRDSSLNNGIPDSYPKLDSIMLSRHHAFLQKYSQTLIHNEGFVK